jgi:hypothetical protein
MNRAVGRTKGEAQLERFTHEHILSTVILGDRVVG